MSEGAKLKIEDIKIGVRYRKRLRNIEELASSISEVGLLHPVVVTPDGTLVAGQRRIAACELLGLTEVPVYVVSNLDDALKIMAERDENVCRDDMLPSEKVALGLALEELERPAASERKGEGQRLGGEAKKLGDKLSGSSKVGRGAVRDLVGAAVGMAGATYTRAKAVVKAANDGVEGADKALERMDRTGKVTGAFNDIAHRLGMTSTLRKPKKPVPLATQRQRDLASAQQRRIETALAAIGGYCRGLDDVDINMAMAAMTNADRQTWATAARTYARQLSKLSRAIQPGGEDVESEAA